MLIVTWVWYVSILLPIGQACSLIWKIKYFICLCSQIFSNYKFQIFRIFLHDPDSYQSSKQGRPFDHYYVKFFQRHFAIFMP